MQTDTIPGLCVSALSPSAVEKIYTLKQRDLDKPPTIIISSLAQLNLFGIEKISEHISFSKILAWSNKPRLNLRS